MDVYRVTQEFDVGDALRRSFLSEYHWDRNVRIF
jgi:hypothetical protein